MSIAAFLLPTDESHAKLVRQYPDLLSIRFSQVHDLQLVFGVRRIPQHRVWQTGAMFQKFNELVCHAFSPLPHSAMCSDAVCELIHDQSKVHVTMVQLPAVHTTQFGWVRNRLPNHPQPLGPVY